MKFLLVICGFLVLAGLVLLVTGTPGGEPATTEVQEPARLETPVEPQVIEEQPPSIVKRVDDRSIRLDDRFTLTGNGTERDPYAISWELLGSAREKIRPTEGRTTPPEHIALLDGSWIRLSGYYSTPLLVVDDVDELLLTLDSWDGCCIGLPPSPFDCLETRLREPVRLKGKHLIRYGTVTGRIRVEPFVVGDWLMGLYRLEDATLEVGSG